MSIIQMCECVRYLLWRPVLMSRFVLLYMPKEMRSFFCRRAVRTQAKMIHKNCVLYNNNLCECVCGYFSGSFEIK